MSTIGLDLGTSRVKAVRFDDAWQPADSEDEATVVQRIRGGGSEQDMVSVWKAAARVVHAVAARSPDRVNLLALTAQGDGCWLVDVDGNPVRPAMLWNDNRAAAILKRWDLDGRLETAFRINGCYGAPGLAHAQLTWLRQHEPESIRVANRLLSCGSWVYQQLTGRQVLEVSDAANPFLDARSRDYSNRLAAVLGIEDFVGLLPDIVSGKDRVAELLPDVADHLGLRPGIPVALAPYDVVATAVGVGSLQPGDAFAILGTTLCVGTVTHDPHLDRTPNGMTLPGPTPDSWLLAYATLNGTEILDWAAETLGLDSVSGLMDLARTAGPDRPLVLPYLSPAGERSPFLDGSVRGSISGLSTRHTRADIARATVDGLTLVLLDCLKSSGAPQRLALAGGGARSSLWCQAISDATGVPVFSPDTDEVGARGAVLTAAVDAGQLSSLVEAVAAAVSTGEQHEPDHTETARFAEVYGEFLRTRQALL